ncbi:hypothetical protein [Haloferula sp. A504]|uniref:hypothetical protein n=1 Tax=Haloferula sp. A504 TaxID=3373601 RepID=UPI0031C5CCD7|nr:hypothetical protein [Verrucomicrobiaceae bacterium E54]
MKSLPVLAVVWIAMVFGVPAAPAEYRSIAVSEIGFEEAENALETALKHPVSPWGGAWPDVRVNGEAYFLLEFDEEDRQPIPQGEGRVFFKVPEDGRLSGVIDLGPGGDGATVASFAFQLAADAGESCDEEQFLKARRAWASRRMQAGGPGKAWFRHLAGKRQEDDAVPRVGERLDDSFQVFSGGRAISENLALDRDLILATSEDAEAKPVPVADIVGITVAEIDWAERLPEGEIAVDPLARFIPHDQHAMFSPSLPTLLGLLDRLEREPVSAFSRLDARNPYAELIGRYRRQLGLDLPDVTTRLLPVKSVALTGGDAFFPTGTDVALLFETGKPDLLFDMLAKSIGLRVGIDGVEAEGGDSTVLSFVSPDRSVSSHLVKVKGLVAVTNSPVQVGRLTEVALGKAEALGGTDEFRFFRARYPLDDPGSAFVFLSDATIRRWAGPELRIGVSRRNRALAALDELTSRGISGEGGDEDYAELLGKVEIVDGMARSGRFGDAGFLTPVSELAITEASAAERDAYVRWRTGYEQGWSQVFDPIALRLSIDEDGYDADLTVLPLTVGSDYREMMAFAGDSELSEKARTRPATSMLHLALAVDADGPMFEDFNQQLTPMLPGLKIKPLSWVGDAISIDLHQSLLWEHSGDLESMAFELWNKIPVSMRIESRSAIKLGLFLTAMRGMVETSAPDTMKWETHKHGDRSYIVIRSVADMGEDFRICYAIMPKALILALDERILRNAMDLGLAEAVDAEAVNSGRSLSLDASPGFLVNGPIGLLLADTDSLRQRESWAALSILNEWHRIAPDEQALQFHENHFGSRIACPGGKGFHWNEEARTFESAAYGHPAAPRMEGEPVDFFERFERLRTALDFEDDGLRARLHAGQDQREETSAAEREGGRKLADIRELVPLKPGRVLHYEGANAMGKHTWSWEVKTMEKTEDGTRIVTEEPYADPDGEGVYRGTSLIGDGEQLLSWTEGEHSGEYPEPERILPKEFREGAVHRSRSSWTSRYVEEGETELDRGKTEIEIRVLGLEDVEVPAGTFKDCVVVERRTEQLSEEWFDVSSERQWYHPGTGLVQSEDLTGFAPVMKLVRIEEGGD